MQLPHLRAPSYRPARPSVPRSAAVSDVHRACVRAFRSALESCGRHPLALPEALASETTVTGSSFPRTMLNRLRSSVFGSGVGHPSVVCVLGDPSSKGSCVHIVPEDGSIESFGFQRPSADTFRQHGAEEVTRRRLAEWIIYKGEGESEVEVMEAVGAAAHKVWELQSQRDGTDAQHPTVGGSRSATTTSTDSVEACQRVLEVAVRSESARRDGRPSSDQATQTVPVYLVWVVRTRPGRLTTDRGLTSIP